MQPYLAPLKELEFLIKKMPRWAQIQSHEKFSAVDDDTALAILEEFAKFSGEVLSPLNALGDQQPAILEKGRVTTTPGFKDAFEQYVRAGWQSLSHPTEFGGQAIAKTIATLTMEMQNAANMSFALCPLLTDGAIEALLVAGSAEQKEKWLPRMMRGDCTGTMNLTEPQAGSDLAAITTRAEPDPDRAGHYLLSGTKIYITYGAHDFTDNIVHLVLARIAGAPAGVKGLSLFLVPQQRDDGSANDVQCLHLEHKMGIKASPTATLQFGDQGGAQGELIGEANQGLVYMFIMMNAARFGVGVQGLGVAQRATQQAAHYAQERIQGRALGQTQIHPIAQHPDVQRMLLTMYAHTETMRYLVFDAAAEHDLAHIADSNDLLEQQRYEFLVPIVKAYCTEIAQEVTALNVQIHGGMGFIEETGAAQYQRDARILTIYEGTTAIQANDFISRKLLRDNGTIAHHYAAQIAATAQALRALAQHNPSAQPQLEAAATQLYAAHEDYLTGIAYVLKVGLSPQAFAASVPLVMLTGTVLCGHWAAQALLQAIEHEAQDAPFYAQKIQRMRFFMHAILPRSHGYAQAVTGSSTVVVVAAGN